MCYSDFLVYINISSFMFDSYAKKKNKCLWTEGQLILANSAKHIKNLHTGTLWKCIHQIETPTNEIPKS